MDHYAGLDVSLEETAICVVDGTGRMVKETRAASEPEALITALQALGLPLERIRLEACSHAMLSGSLQLLYCRLRMRRNRLTRRSFSASVS